MRKTILTALSLVTVAAALALTSPHTAIKVPRGSSAPPVSPQRVIKKAAGTAYSLPLLYEPTQAQFTNSVLLDVNNDGKTWNLMSGFISYGYHMKNAADDWLFVPISLTKEVNDLKVSLEYRAQASYDKESFEIAFGPEAKPEGMITCIDIIDFTNTQFKTADAITSINGAGIVYMGIHAKSEAYCSGIRLRNIYVEDFGTPVPLSPAITASKIDGLEYTATVKLPTSTKQGKDIEGKVGLLVAVDGTQVEDRGDCEAGSEQDIKLELAKGTHTISYTAYVIDAGAKSFGDPVAENVKAVNLGPQALPLFIAPTSDDWDACMVKDANNDKSTWEFDQSEEAFRYSYASKAADDWLFLPLINFGENAGAFDLVLEAKVAADYCPESFEVCVGRNAEPESMAVMMSQTDIKNKFFEEFTGKITIPEGGNWYVGIHCVSSPDMYNLYIRNISITAAADITPALPTVKNIAFDGLSGIITYTLPSLTVEDKELKVPVGLIVNVDGEEVSRTTPAAPGTDVDVPLTLAIGNRTVTASAFVVEDETELVGSPVVSRILARNPEGYVYPLPFSMRPTLGEFETLTTADANGSGLTWAYNSGADNGKGAVMMRTTENKASDAWIFFPKVAVSDVNRIYTVSADIRAYLEQFPEDFDICIGKDSTPEAMTEVIVSKRGYNNYLYTTQAGEFIASEAGNYVIGIHRLSGAEAHTLSLCNIQMYDSGKSASAPVAADDAKAVSDPTGALKATVTLTMPTVGVNGNTLDPAETLTASVTSPTGATASASGLPGSTVCIEIEAREGVNEFTIVVTSPTHGEGKPATASAFCGFDKPASPTVTATVSEDNMSLILTWTDAERGINGGAVDHATLTHNVYVPVDETGEYWNLVAEIPAGTSTFTYAVPELQNSTIIGVAAVSDKGMSQLGLAVETTGTPYPLPIKEDFTTGRVLYQPLMTPTPTDEYTGWMFTSTSNLFPEVKDMPVALFCINAAGTNVKHSRLSLPKFATTNSNKARVTLSTFASSATPKATLYANIYGKSDIRIADIEAKGNNEWKDIAIDLPAEVLGKKWVNLYIEVDFNGGSEVFILRSYDIRNIFDKQLSTTVSVYDNMIVGDSYTITGKINNPSESAIALPTIKCTLGELELTPEKTDVSEIKPGETVHVNYTVVPTADMIGRHKLRFELVDFNDEINEDNMSEFEVEITAGIKPIVTDLTGTAADNGGVSLSWTTPALHLTGDEDFESYDAFDYSSKLGVWTNRDDDGKYVYGFQGVTFPGQNEPKAFQVINTDMVPAGAMPEAYSGKQYIVAITPDDGSAANDWLISPEVIPGSKVSFRLNILSEAYGMEQIDLLWSADGKEFKLLQTYSQTKIAWNPLEATLPEEARYFAFHYHCTDIFGVCLDDIHFSPVSDAEIDSYHIYCNGEKIVSNHPENTYTHADAKNGDKFNISVVTRAGDIVTEHPLSNTYTAFGLSGVSGITTAGTVIGESGRISISGFEGKDATVAASDGRIMARRHNMSASESINISAGIYIVEIDNASFKVIVR